MKFRTMQKKFIGFAAKNRNFIQFHLPFGKMYYCFAGMNAHTRLSVLLSTIVFICYLRHTSCCLRYELRTHNERNSTTMLAFNGIWKHMLGERAPTLPLFLSPAALNHTIHSLFQRTLRAFHLSLLRSSLFTYTFIVSLLFIHV